METETADLIERLTAARTIRTVRQGANISQRDMAKTLGISQPALCKIEKAEQNAVSKEKLNDIVKTIEQMLVKDTMEALSG